MDPPTKRVLSLARLRLPPYHCGMRNLLFASLLALAACTAAAPDRGYGPDPELGAPRQGILPTINTARAVGWEEGAGPTAPIGFTVTRYAEGIAHPRWLYVLPNGDVLVAQSSTRPTEEGGLMGWIKNMVQRNAGAIEDESPDQITLLRDSDGDGDVDARHVFAENLNQPFGMALVGEHLYVANTDAVVRFPYAPGAVRVSGAPETVLRLPYNEGDNGHWTRSLAVSPGGDKLYVAVGSVSNIPKPDGFAVEEGRAAIWEFNPDGSQARIFASGLRNPVGMEFEPHSGVLWVAVNERDELGDNLPPDYMTSVRDGGFYGWPYSYFGQIVDTRVEPQNPELVARAIRPDYALGAHTASLGLHFYTDDALPTAYRNGVFIGQHGSWNRSGHVGYKVIHVPFTNGRPSGDVQDFLTGFLNENGQAQGRPVGVITDRTGALLVADDVGDIVWRVSYAEAPAQ
jgi:glucose/arabinose dehydrogenase